MKKRILMIVLALALVLSSTLCVFADELPTEVKVNITMMLKKSSAPESDWDTKTIKTTGSAVVDYKAVLDSDAIKDAMEVWYKEYSDRAALIAGGDDTLKATLMDELNAKVIKGTFTVTIEYPSAMVVDSAYLADNKDMYGFNDEAKVIFHEVSRTVEDLGNKKKIVIVIATNAAGDTTKPLLAGDMYANADEYLKDLTFTVEKVKINSPGTYRVNSAFEGTTLFGAAGSQKIDYVGVTNDTDTDLKATVIVENTSTGGGGSHAGSGATLVKKTEPGTGTGTGESGNKTTFNINGTEYEVPQLSEGTTIKVSAIPVPQRDGYTFDGWYKDSEMKEKYDDDEDITIGEDRKLYGRWISNTFDNEQHGAYILGYPDGTVKPSNFITREELTTILYRLLKEGAANAIYTEENDFYDVESDRWSNPYISTMANGEYILGYEDGSFRPDVFMTRAEFAALIVRFANGKADGNATLFDDIGGHWAEEYILSAASEGWISGYENGTFDPDQYITRAEAMTIINRMLSRHVTSDGILPGAKTWSDNVPSAWYYYEVQEATNSHTYTRKADGLSENWVEILF